MIIMTVANNNNNNDLFEDLWNMPDTAFFFLNMDCFVYMDCPTEEVI